MRLTITALLLYGSLPALTAPLSYNRDVRPLLAENCFACHGPDKNARKAKLREITVARNALLDELLTGEQQAKLKELKAAKKGKKKESKDK